jgi:secondary thiamine-phosphate synthase enzyme
MIERIRLRPSGQGLHEFTDSLTRRVAEAGVSEGLCTLYIQHTSASLLIQENADPSARRDLERWLTRLVPEEDALYSHTQEGPDDMPAHVKAALTATTLSIPIEGGQLLLGTWQGVFLWEHRHQPTQRTIIVHISPSSSFSP